MSPLRPPWLNSPASCFNKYNYCFLTTKPHICEGTKNPFALSFAYFIANRITFKSKRTFSKLIVRIAIIGIMLGLGEKEEDVLEAMDDLLAAGVHILTLGQYLQPTRSHHPVVDWVHPDQFAFYKEIGLSKGFRYVESGPLVRSSYHAEKHLFEI